MSVANVITIVSAASALLATIGWCQGSYGLDAESAPVAGLAGCLGSGLTGLDLCGALYRAASEESLMADLDEARQAVANYILATPAREQTPGTVLVEWNDEPGRQVQNCTDTLDEVVTQLSV
jgi:hypothetical protein